MSIDLNEKKFLDDLSALLATAVLRADSIVDHWSKRIPPVDPIDQDQLKTVVLALKKAQGLLEIQENENHRLPIRKFIHDVASPISTALFLVSSLIDVPENPMPKNEDFEPAQSLNKALQEIQQLLKTYREELIAKGVPSAKS